MFFFKAVKINTNILHFPFILYAKKERLLLLIPKNTSDTVLSVPKTKIPTKYRENGTKCFKNLIIQMYQFF